MEQDDVIEEQAKPAKSETWEWIKALVIAGLLVLIIRLFLFAPFVIEGPSMQPNFQDGERLIVNKLIYDIRNPHRGEVVIFQAPRGDDYIKRVIGLPGDKVKIENNTVYVNGEPLDEPYIKEAADHYAKQNNGREYNQPFAEYEVPAGDIFVMGDNRVNSSDSRDPNVGPVAFGKIVGRADFIFWPMGKFGFVHHAK